MAERFVNAYRQAPWRTQMQWIGVFMLALVVLVLIAGLYLNVTAQAAAAGVEIRVMENDREEFRRQIADQRSQLAYLTSAMVMEQRAMEQGYERANMENAVYVVVPGYTGRQLQPLALPSDTKIQTSIVLPSYKQSLWEWIFQKTLRFNRTLGN